MFDMSSLDSSKKSQNADTRIEKDQTVGSNQINAATTCLTAKQKDSGCAFRIVELVNQLLPLLDPCAAFEPEVLVAVVATINTNSGCVDIDPYRFCLNNFSKRSRVSVKLLIRTIRSSVS